MPCLVLASELLPKPTRWQRAASTTAIRASSGSGVLLGDVARENKRAAL